MASGKTTGMKGKRNVVLVCVTLLLAGELVRLNGQDPSPASPSRQTSTPYTGDLSIFDYPERAQKLHIDQVMDLLGIAPGKAVADIGAGSGWFTVLAAKRVTNSGKVFAVDINPQSIQYIQQRAQKDGLANIITVLGTADDPRLPSSTVHAVLLLKTYHEIAQPVALMRHLQSSLHPTAMVGIIDRNGSGTDHGVQKKVVIEEMKSAGYRLIGEHNDLVKGDKMDYFLIFQPTSSVN